MLDFEQEPIPKGKVRRENISKVRNTLGRHQSRENQEANSNTGCGVLQRKVKLGKQSEATSQTLLIDNLKKS